MSNCAPVRLPERNSSQNFKHPDDSLPALVNQFNSDLSKLLDKHAPLTPRSLPILPFSPWYDDQLIAAKQERRRRESQWRISKLTVHRQLYIEQRQLVMKLLRAKRMEFYGNQAKENPSNARVIFSTANKLLQRNIEKPLPKHKSTSELAKEFSAFLQTRSALLANASVVLVRTQLIRNSPLNYHMEHLLYRISVSSMRKRYGRSSAHPYLSPVAWIHYQHLFSKKILTSFYHP